MNPISVRRASALSALIAVGASLSACGFTPLYATPGVGSGLTAIEVVAPEGRVGFLVREDLDDVFARDKTKQPQWRLDLQTDQTRDPRGLRADNVAERYELGLTVRYTLTSVATGRPVHTGEVRSQVSYDAADAPYAGIAARQDSQSRVAADAARRIEVDLAAWMAKNRQP